LDRKNRFCLMRSSLHRSTTTTRYLRASPRTPWWEGQKTPWGESRSLFEGGRIRWCRHRGVGIGALWTLMAINVFLLIFSSIHNSGQEVPPSTSAAKAASASLSASSRSLVLGRTLSGTQSLSFLTPLSARNVLAYAAGSLAFGALTRFGTARHPLTGP
jgi:hypothetical protein